MDDGVTSNHRGMLDSDIASAEIGNLAAGFSDEQTAGGNVPGGEMLFPKTIEPTRSNIGEA